MKIDIGSIPLPMSSPTQHYLSQSWKKRLLKNKINDAELTTTDFTTA